MADETSDQSAVTGSGQSWLDKILGAATGVADSAAKVLAANEAADAERDKARAAAATASARTTTQPNWLLIGGIGAAVLLVIGLVAFRKN